MNAYPLLTNPKKRRSVARMIWGYISRRNHFNLQLSKSRDEAHQRTYLASMAIVYDAKAEAAREVLRELFE